MSDKTSYSQILTVRSTRRIEREYSGRQCKKAKTWTRLRNLMPAGGKFSLSVLDTSSKEQRGTTHHVRIRHLLDYPQLHLSCSSH